MDPAQQFHLLNDPQYQEPPQGPDSGSGKCGVCGSWLVGGTCDNRCEVDDGPETSKE